MTHCRLARAEFQDSATALQRRENTSNELTYAPFNARQLLLSTLGRVLDFLTGSFYLLSGFRRCIVELPAGTFGRSFLPLKSPKRQQNDTDNQNYADN